MSNRIRMGVVNRRSTRGMFLVALAAVAAPAATGQANDSWSSKVVLRDDQSGDYLAPIHASLLPDGSIMLIGYAQTQEEPQSVAFRTGSFTALLTPPPLGQDIPAEMQITSYAEDLEYDLTMGGSSIIDTYFCSSHVLLGDGTLMIAGGLRVLDDWNDPQLGTLNGGGGIPYGATWDHTNKVWTRTADMAGVGQVGPFGTYFEGPDRYYPTSMKLPTGEVMVIAGSQVLGVSVNGGAPVSGLNLSAETYHPTTGTWTEISSVTHTPADVFNRDYTHTFVLPDTASEFDVVMIGEQGLPRRMLSTVNPVTWSSAGPKRPGPDATNPNVPPCEGASTLMLPIRRINGQWGYPNGTILVAGGEGDYHDEVDLYNPVGNGWADGQLLAVDRHHPSTVLLPNGEVMVVCGHASGASPSLLRKAEYINPRTGFSHQVGQDEGYKERGYHTVTLLLPDGRVFVGGGRVGGPVTSPVEKANFELLSPPYMNNPRPVLNPVPGVMKYGQNYTITWQGEAADAVVVALGSMTHSIDMNQRHVNLRVSNRFSNGAGTFGGNLNIPNDSQLLPPGPYMLFILAADSSRTPSVARIINIEP